MARSGVVAEVHSIDSVSQDSLGAELYRAYGQSLRCGFNTDPVLQRTLAHVLAHPGSLARPRMSVQTGLAYGAERQSTLDLAIALEYFHTASLLFDDLPCMDDAAVRRGAPCVHRLFGEPAAILAALTLINRAYGLVWSALRTVPLQHQVRVFEFLNDRLGVNGLLNGQSLDLNFQSSARDLAEAERVARGKTVPMIEIALVLPAILAQAPQRDIQLLQRLSLFWGLAYQLADDLKDVLASQSDTGKSAERDGRLGRPNTALVIGIPAAVGRLGRLIHAGDRLMNRLIAKRSSLNFLNDFRTSLLDELTNAIEEAGAIPIDRVR
ncbi:MAG: polyprenyl synthetase family protein [Acidobacteriota bacterium]|nr:polyprenyl synthetase family protein [Acidobacteriota bacterium]